jgi:hypothetical protein
MSTSTRTEDVLDDQPADRDVAGGRVQLPVVRQHANENDRARDRQRDAEYDPGSEAPACRLRDDGSERRGGSTLSDGAGNRDSTNGKELFDVELQADAKHQQDDADLGELLGQGAIGDEPGRVRADQNASDQIPDNRRKPQPLRDEPASERGNKAGGQREDQIEAMHASSFHTLRARPFRHSPFFMLFTIFTTYMIRTSRAAT